MRFTEARAWTSARCHSVNLDVAQFLATCESEGIQLLNCPTYIRKWIDREKVTGPKS